uniref:Oxysterol-binding protein n=1 Tax=Erpetoichthys calabaricus TaxID=27687 RepID=A0A8C4TMQ5_ERPCA
PLPVVPMQPRGAATKCFPGEAVCSPWQCVEGASRLSMGPSHLSQYSKKNYREEKKRAAKELFSALKDPTVIIMANWLKIRGTLKSWTKLWCVLKPGVLLIYKTPKVDHWVGTILLSACKLIERPSKKDGFCFKLYHPLDKSIWTMKGPKGENVGSITQPLPSSYLIFRAVSESDGELNESTLRNHHMENDTCSDKSERETHEESENGTTEKSRRLTEESDTDQSEIQTDLSPDVVSTIYNEQTEEEMAGETSQTETVSEENKGLIWTLLKQLRPGMDLSRVVLPTFILEPRSFLDKLSDYYYHANFLSEYAKHENVFCVFLVFQGLKKPYNPILGETFRCRWYHPQTNSCTFYIAEQVSHHPPVSAFYVSNQKDGFCISGSILAKSKYYGNSLSAVLDGTAKLLFLNLEEEYVITMPYAHCKGILYGKLTMELGGKVTIVCEKTKYSTELEFKLKPLFGGYNSVNQISGTISLGNEVMATVEGHWDGEVFLDQKMNGHKDLFWSPTSEVRMQRLRRQVVQLGQQGEFESERLWQHVTSAIKEKDQLKATQEKYILEEAQRQAARERKDQPWHPRLFQFDPITNEWHYKYAK